MPVLIPIVAAGAAYFGAGAVVGALAISGWAAVAVGVVAGAVIGAAVGAVGALVTGGDIGEGALWGAIGGAVAGGFAGYSAVGAAGGTSTNAEVQSLATNIRAESALAPAAEKGAEAGLLGLTEGEGTLGAAGLTMAGNAIQGYAGGEAAGKMNEDKIAADKEARDAQFAQNMKEMQLNHDLKMQEITGSGNPAVEVANLNNAAAMNQLNTRIGADKDTVTAANADRDAKQLAFNDSVRGTDATLFDRPAFSFNPGDESAFNSGFDEAVAAKAPLTPGQQALLNQQATA